MGVQYDRGQIPTIAFQKAYDTPKITMVNSSTNTEIFVPKFIDKEWNISWTYTYNFDDVPVKFQYINQQIIEQLCSDNVHVRD